MALLVDLPSVYAGALQLFTVPCASVLASGETITGATAGVEIWPYSPVQDANASQLLRGSAIVSGSNVQAWVGGISTTTNFVEGAVYSLGVQLTTSLGNTPIAIGNITVSAISPPALGSGASLPSTEFSISGNFAPSAPGLYHVTAAAVCAIPATNIGGDIEIVNESAGNVTFTGSALNYAVLPTLTPGASCTLHWSTLKSGILILS